MAVLWTHILRGLQLGLGALVLGLAIASCATFYVVGFYPSQSAFLVFCGAWTILVALYFLLAPRVAPKATHPIARVVVDAITCVFWFAGFIALAVAVSAAAPVVGSVPGADPVANPYPYQPQRSATTWFQLSAAAAAFAGAEWALFVVTTVFSSVELYRSDRSTLFSTKKDNPGDNRAQAPAA